TSSTRTPHSFYIFVVSSHFFFFNDTATTEIYTLSLHDALPISADHDRRRVSLFRHAAPEIHHRGYAGAHPIHAKHGDGRVDGGRSEEHTSELQSRGHLVCRLLLEKKKETAQEITRVHEAENNNA